MRALLDDAAVVQHQDAIAATARSRAGARSPAWCGPASAASSAACTSVSLSASSEEVASSSSRIGASRRMARAMAMRWRWPPDSVTPRSPTRRLVALRQRADELGRRRRCSAARSISASLASGRPKRMLSRDSCAKIAVSCGTSAMCRRTSCGSASRRSTPSNVTVPRLRIVEPQDQVKDRALAGARGADDRDLLAGLDAKRHVVEHVGLGPRRIGKAHAPRTRPRRAAAAAAASDAPAPGSPARSASNSASRSAAPAACESSPQTSVNWPSPLAANTA